MAAQYNPLSDEVCDTCNAALRSLPDIQAVIEKCIRCGMPMEPAREQAQSYHDFFSAVKREFFPLKP